MSDDSAVSVSIQSSFICYDDTRILYRKMKGDLIGVTPW